MINVEKYFGDKYKEKGQFRTGSTKLSKYTLTKINTDKMTVTANVCVDTRSNRLHESNGTTVKRHPQIPLKAWKKHVVTYDEVQGKWIVTTFDSTGSKKC